MVSTDRANSANGVNSRRSPGRRLFFCGIIASSCALIFAGLQLYSFGYIVFARVAPTLATVGIGLLIWGTIRHHSTRRVVLSIVVGLSVLAAWIHAVSISPKTEELRWTNGDVRLAGTLYLPRTKGPHPAVIFLHGSGDEVRSRLYPRSFAYRLARVGYATLIYDKRGCGESTGQWRAVGFEELARDGLAGAAELKSRQDIDATKIGVLGVSQGGWLGPLAASLSHDVSFVVMIAGPPMTPADQGLYEMEVDLLAKGVSRQDLPPAIKLVQMELDCWRTDNGWSELAVAIDREKGEPWFPHTAVDAEPNRESWHWSWYRRVMDFDPLPILEQLDVPVFAGYGGKDKLVPGEKSAEIMRTIKETHDKDFTVVLFPSCGHDLPALFGFWPPQFWVKLDAWLDSLEASGSQVSGGEIDGPPR